MVRGEDNNSSAFVYAPVDQNNHRNDQMARAPELSLAADQPSRDVFEVKKRNI